MGPLGKQFRHIGDVQLCYVEALKTKKIDFGKYRKDYSIENSKEKLKAFLKEMDDEIFSLLKKLDPKQTKEFRVDWGFDKLSLEDHLKFLIQHEIFHHGQLVVYIRDLGLIFPKSWSVWGM